MNKKYQGIYKVINQSKLDYLNDRSYWFYPEEKQDYVMRNQPLWLILESKILNKRIWVTHSYNRYEIATADLGLNVNSREYSDSFKHRFFDKQKDLIVALIELLYPCRKEIENGNKKMFA